MRDAVDNVQRVVEQILRTSLGFSPGPGNAVVVAFEYDYIIYVATAFGFKNVPLMDVA